MSLMAAVSKESYLPIRDTLTLSAFSAAQVMLWGEETSIANKSTPDSVILKAFLVLNTVSSNQV
jgi:hypothetical protein